MRIGVLTGGGDVPGLNPTIRAIARRLMAGGAEALGIRNGWAGLLNPDTIPLTHQTISGILHRGGTMLGTSRVDPVASSGDVERLLSNARELGLDSLIVMGGDGTLSACLDVHERGLGIVGIPKTIDNDVPGTEYSLGFDSAVTEVMEALDRLHTTAEAHHRVIVLEVMGNEAGWLAAVGGIAGGADIIVVPEVPASLDDICHRLHIREGRGKQFSLVVVAEGATVEGVPHPEGKSKSGYGAGSIGPHLARAIQDRTSYQTRVSVLGYLQRGGSPTAYDRVMGTRMGAFAAELALSGQTGKMVALVRGQVTAIPLATVRGPKRNLDTDLWELAQLFC